MCCPMMSAWDLHKAWPEADFRVRLKCCFWSFALLCGFFLHAMLIIDEVSG